MRSFEPSGTPTARRPWWILLVAVLASGLVLMYVSTRPDTPPAGGVPAPAGADDPPRTSGEGGTPETPTTGNDAAAATERLDRNGTPAGRGAARPGRATEAPRPSATPKAGAAARELRVTSDVDGAYVFLDRKFLGSTPLVSREVTPGTHQLNVQTEGRTPVVRTIEVAAEGPTEVAVTLAPAPAAAAAQLNASVAVVHQHAVGSCEGTLHASGDGFRYDTAHKDAFTLPFAGVETFTVDYADKRLRLKQRGGRTWNFTTRAANADPLFVFHRDVEAVRKP